ISTPGKPDSLREIKNAKPPKHEGPQAVYEFTLPWKDLGITSTALAEEGVHLDFLVGDDDGEGLDTLLHTRPEQPNAENMQKAGRFLFK
ncbi:MAG: hypothetical protein ACI4UF_07725, partial [Thermoguttaceae bacterium]